MKSWLVAYVTEEVVSVLPELFSRMRRTSTPNFRLWRPRVRLRFDDVGAAVDNPAVRHACNIGHCNAKRGRHKLVRLIACTGGATGTNRRHTDRLRLDAGRRIRSAHDTAHNAGFDIGFLRAAAQRCEIPWSRPPVLCTVRLARRVLSREEAPSVRLAALARLFAVAAQFVLDVGYDGDGGKCGHADQNN